MFRIAPAVSGHCFMIFDMADENSLLWFQLSSLAQLEAGHLRLNGIKVAKVL